MAAKLLGSNPIWWEAGKPEELARDPGIEYTVQDKHKFMVLIDGKGYDVDDLITFGGDDLRINGKPIDSSRPIQVGDVVSRVNPAPARA